MLKTDSKADELYKPEIKTVEDLVGYAGEAGRQSDKITVVSKDFLTSFDQKESKIMENLIREFSTDRQTNDLLVVIRDKVAKIYKQFPIILNVRSKTQIDQHQAVFKDQILDIEGVEFYDAYFNLDIQDNDKFFWLFRNGFNFGLYFDFSGKLKVSELYPKLGKCYKNLEYYAVYSYFQQSENARVFLEKGWFPFAQLIGSDLESLVSADSDSADVVVDIVINKFNKERIESFVSNWWQNEVFAKKKNLIGAGISAFLQNTPEGNINCIKTLILEIEGVARIDFYNEKNKNPNTEELKSYLVNKAKQKFSIEDSFGFPGLFAEYLNSVIFKNFDLATGSVDYSRNSVGHGVAAEELFTRARALQCILTLDQIYFYLGATKPTEREEKN